MYKTIRHGENSLQYTILPQNDDFRIEGKLSSAESNCSRRSKKSKRPKRRSFFAYLGLIFVCTVIVGAILIPFLVSAECLPSPTEWFLKTKAAFTKSVSKEFKHTNNNSNPIKHEKLIDNTSNIGKHVKIINKNGIEQFILQYNKTKNLTTNTKVNTVTQSNAVLINENNNNNNATIPTTLNVSKPLIEVTHNNEADNAIDAISQDNYSQERNPNFQDIGNDIPPQDQIATTNAEHLINELRFNNNNNNNNNYNVQSNFAVIAPTIVVTTVRTQVLQNDNINIKNNNNNINSDNLKESTEPASIKTNAINTTRPTVTLSIISNVVAVNSPRAPTNTINNQNITPNAIPTIITRIIQVPLLKSAAKKPIIPTVLNKTTTQQQLQQQLITHNAKTNHISTAAVANNKEQTENTNWINTHWPHIDASSYFQWTGYKAENSVLLPALLGFTLIGIILSITVCLVARNKRTIVSSVRKRNRNDIEETGTEDNATLLATTSLSDED